MNLCLPSDNNKFTINIAFNKQFRLHYSGTIIGNTNFEQNQNRCTYKHSDNNGKQPLLTDFQSHHDYSSIH